jgi:hypothetical protein
VPKHPDLNLVALPPFQIATTLKMHWRRRFYSDPRNLWLRAQPLSRQWLAADWAGAFLEP